MWPATASCPLGLSEQAWIEFSLRKLIALVGVDRVLTASLMTDESLPRDETGNLVELTVRHFCSLLDIDRGAFEFEVVPAGEMAALGLWVNDPPRILISEKAAATEAGLLSTVAHELMHEFLLRRGLLTGLEPDHEQLTDLATAMLGLGIPHANSAFEDRSENLGTFSIWQAEKRGYLSAMQMGYAMAVVARFRGDDPEPYFQNLRGDAKSTFSSAWAYLAGRTNPVVVRGGDGRVVVPTAPELMQDLEGEDDCRRLCALWQLALEGDVDVELQDAAVPSLSSREPDIRLAAVEVLCKFEHVGVRNELPRLLTDDSIRVRAAACRASAPYLKASLDLTRLVFEGLQERSDTLVNAAAEALCVSETRHEIRVEPIVRMLREAVHRRPEVHREPLLYLLTLHCPDPETVLREAFASETDQKELEEVLAQLRSLPASEEGKEVEWPSIAGCTFCGVVISAEQWDDESNRFADGEREARPVCPECQAGIERNDKERQAEAAVPTSAGFEAMLRFMLLLACIGVAAVLIEVLGRWLQWGRRRG
ncbi:MAG TPA: HEAT repeat domain-containing protein [Caulifigura sp.]|nr:HEAT repeat domain-containing protein [Caulifigura sp.]